MKYLLLGLLGLSIQSFAQDNHFEHGNHTSTHRTAVGIKAKEEVIAVLQKNDLLFYAFLAKDEVGIEKLAKELHADVTKSNHSLLDEVKAAAWNLSNIKASHSNEVNLRSYESFVKPLIRIVESKDIGGKFNVFTCPMVKKSWIQNIEIHKEAKNIYAMDMLECGTQNTHY